MSSVIYLGLTLGFGLSTSCAALCTPILVPYIVSSEHPSLRRGFFSAVVFSSGRLISYLSLGLIFGLLVTSFEINPVITATTTLVLGCLLILQGFSSLGVFSVGRAIGSNFCQYIATRRSLVYMGILTGLRPCVPLLAALTYSVTLSGIAEVLLFMLAFWLASSLLIFLIGPISGSLAAVAGKRISVQRVRRISGVALVVVGLFFIAQAAGLIVYHFSA